jgi:hypothetical protein
MSTRPTTSPELTEQEARQLIDRIKTGLETLVEDIAQAHSTRAWLAVGYQSWEELCAKEFDSDHLRITREERPAVVEFLRAAGMTYREIAAATGMSKDTAQRTTTSLRSITRW